MSEPVLLLTTGREDVKVRLFSRGNATKLPVPYTLTPILVRQVYTGQKSEYAEWLERGKRHSTKESAGFDWIYMYRYIEDVGVVINSTSLLQVAEWNVLHAAGIPVIEEDLITYAPRLMSSLPFFMELDGSPMPALLLDSF